VSCGRWASWPQPRSVCQLLIIIFGKSEKIDYLIFYSETFGFQDKIKEVTKLEDLKIQNILRYEKN
jgi:hypothetical protein